MNEEDKWRAACKQLERLLIDQENHYHPHNVCPEQDRDFCRGLLNGYTSARGWLYTALGVYGLRLKQKEGEILTRAVIEDELPNILCNDPRCGIDHTHVWGPSIHGVFLKEPKR